MIFRPPTVLPVCVVLAYSQITRLNTAHPNMSQTVVHNDTVYLAGQVPNDYSAGIKQQTEEVLAKVDQLLEVRKSQLRCLWDA